MKVLCFAPNDAVWRWTLPQAQFLEVLKKRGDEIIYVYCDREYASHCMSMAAFGVPFSAALEEKTSVCDICQRQSEMVRASFGFAGRSFRSFISETDRDEANRISRDLTFEELTCYSVDGIPVGKFALFETIIQTKSISMSLSAEAERFYRANFRNTLVSVAGTREMLAELKPDVGLSYHTAYAYNRVFQTMTEAQGIPVWFLNASLNVAELDSHLVAARSDPDVLYHKLLADWPRFRDVTCDSGQIASAADHIISLMSGGGYAYSQAMSCGAEEPLRRLGCPRGKKVILATLSSYDEMVAAEAAGFGWSTRNAVFGSQIEWVRWLFEFASSRDDIHIIVRVHPREFQIRGKGVRSEHSYLLEAAFVNRPLNVSINLPTDEIPLYDLLIEADVVLTAWSSAGMEAGMLGIPVVTYAGDVSLFPRSLVFDATTRAQYKAMVNEAIDAGWSLERARMFFRWAVLMLTRTRIDVSNGATIPVRRSRILNFTIRARNWLLANLTPWGREKWSIILRPRHLNDAPKILDLIDRRLDAFHDDAGQPVPSTTEDAELAAVRLQLLRIARLIQRFRGRKLARLEAFLARPADEPGEHFVLADNSARKIG